MKLLLDTHTFLWFIMGDNRLSDQAKKTIEVKKHEKLISVASLWEMAIKVSIGRLNLTESFGTLIPRQIKLNGFQLLNIKFQHVANLVSIPFHHRDPFDRLLISQCMVENIPIVSKDIAFDSYPIERYWIDAFDK
jgi:PIN domain nuclease of toxin-antitoxin system